MTWVRLEPAALRSPIKQSTTELPPLVLFEILLLSSGHFVHSGEIILNLDRWFRRRCHLNEKFTYEVYRTETKHNSSTMSLWLRRAKKMKNVHPYCKYLYGKSIRIQRVKELNNWKSE